MRNRLSSIIVVTPLRSLKGLSRSLPMLRLALPAFCCLATLLTGLVRAESLQPVTPPKRQENAPFSVTLRPSETNALSLSTDFSAATESELFPGGLVDMIEPIARNELAEVRILARWADDMLTILKATIWFWEHGQYEQCWSCLGRLEQETIELARYRQSWMPELREGDGKNPPSPVALEELQLALERRAILWRQALRAETGPSRPVSAHFAKGATEIRRLAQLTLGVESYFLDENSLSSSGEQIGGLWCDYLDTKSFIAELEACQKSVVQPNRRVSNTPSTIPIPMLVSFCDRANVILRRLDERKLTKEQTAYLGTPVVVAWKEELKQWSADTVSSRVLIREMERYEEHAGMSDMEALFRTITRLSFAPTEAYRHLGMMTHEIYGGSNIKLYVSKVLVNHLLPPSAPETAMFREIIQGQQVVGRRQADLAIEMNFVPDPERILLSLDVKGSISTQSQARAFATTLLNGGRAECVAQKKIELTEQGFQLFPTQVRVEKNRLQLRYFQTEFDGIPLVSGLFRGVVQNQYESRLGGAREETRRKIVRQMKTRIDKEADGRFGEFNEKFQDFMTMSMSEFDLFLEKKNASTEDHWLRTSWALRSQDSLCGNTPAPETLPGAFADLKIHESALNSMLGKLGIDGKDATVGELKHMIADRFQRPEWAKAEENDDIRIAFSAYNPLVVRFQDNVVVLTISIAALRLKGKTHRDFQVVVKYRPVVNEQGDVLLQREKLIQFIDVSMGSQFALRAAFGKIFPLQRPYSLAPKFLENDPRFKNLATGQCRIEKGWFALALVADGDGQENSMVSDRLPEKKVLR